MSYPEEDYQRRILTQLNQGEGRHAVARIICNGQRGEIRKRYREGQEDHMFLSVRFRTIGLRGRKPIKLKKNCIVNLLATHKTFIKMINSKQE